MISRSALMICVFLISSLVTSVSNVRSTLAQAVVSDEAAPPPESDVQLRVFQLRYAKAAAAATTISELFGGQRSVELRPSLAVDERTNSVIVQASPRESEVIAAVLKEIDAPAINTNGADEVPETAEDDASLRFQLFYLKHVEADVAARLLSSLLRGAEARIVADKRLNGLYIQAKEPDQHTIASLLERIDIESAPDPPLAGASADSQRRLMFYWLASGRDFETDKPVPRHLQPVIEGLEEMGIQNVQLVSRSVAALDGRDVTLNSTVRASNRTFNLELEGRLTSEGDETPRLNLNVRANQADDVSHVETTITAPYNHFVVLGTTGLGDLENAFVIQIQSVEPARQESGRRQ